MKINILSFVLASSAFTCAHSIFCQLESAGITKPVAYGIRTPTSNGPLFDVSSNDLACNGGPNPTTPSDKVIDVVAGSTVTAIWRHTLQSDSTDIATPAHLGPTIAYLKKVDDSTTDTGYGNGW